VYSQHTDSFYISSNRINGNINITIFNLKDDSVSSARYPGLTEANGGCTYVPPDQLHNTAYIPEVLFCDQGNFTKPSELVLVDPVSNATTPLINSFLGRNFSSPNDVRQHYTTGDLWFTDPSYGFVQGFRPAPQMPDQVYRFEPLTGVVEVVADGFVKPNGFEFSPDFVTAYITDTGAQEYSANYSRPATIYAYDVVDAKRLANRRVFAYSDVGIPDGIHTDAEGNVWSGCGDGIHVWNKEGTLLGKLVVEGGTSNFAFMPGAVLMFNAEKLWKVAIKVQGREVARDFKLTKR
jgi:gluconolactonase